MIYDFVREIYRNRKVKKPRKSAPRLWHYENADCSPLCRRPTPPAFWEAGDPPNGWGLQTTASANYVTCPRCLKLMKERGIIE